MKATTKVSLVFLLLVMGTTIAYHFINPEDKAGLGLGVCSMLLAGWMLKRDHKAEQNG